MQAAYYEGRKAGLGKRYHAAMLRTLVKACETPTRFRIVRLPDLRTVALRGFPLAAIYRAIGDEVQVLAIAHHRRRPGYWGRRS
jgi:hypothetical protein